MTRGIEFNATHAAETAGRARQFSAQAHALTSLANEIGAMFRTGGPEKRR
jgi:hypothetical protein